MIVSHFLLRRSIRVRHLEVLRRFLPVRHVHARPPKPPTPPMPPRPPQKPVGFTFHDETWHDPYSWMSDLQDKVAMRHMDVYMEQEEKYTEAVMSETGRLQRKLQREMGSRMGAELSTPPVRFGPWLYYRRVEQGKQYPVLCRRLASLNEEIMSYKSPSAGFDFMSGRKIEQKLLDYNEEAERFGGYAYEELSEVSPDHCFLAYTMYNKEIDSFSLSVKDLSTASLCNSPKVDRVANLAWAMGGKALLYTVTDTNRRPYRLFCSLMGSGKDDILLMEELDDSVYINIRNTKDFQFVTVNSFSNAFSKVYLINSACPSSEMELVWEGEPHVHCIVEHHQGFLYLFTDASRDGMTADSHYLLRAPLRSALRNWEVIFLNEPHVILEDVDFCVTHMVLILREGKNPKICSISLPLSIGDKMVPTHLDALGLCFLPLPPHVCHVSPGPNYDFYSSTMRFIVSSPVMPDAVVDYDLLTGKWHIVQQQNVLHERTRILYGTSVSSTSLAKLESSQKFEIAVETDDDNVTWNDLSQYYACEYYDVLSKDGAIVPLTVLYSHKTKQGGPGLLHGHGAYGELLDKRWRTELKSLLDRGWVVAYADVRGGGGKGKRWHHDGRRLKKLNSVHDYIACATFLMDKEIVHPNKLAGWGYSAGGLLIASAINIQPDLLRAAVLKVPFLDVCNTLLHPVLPLSPADYEEFGYPGNFEEFQAIRQYSPYDNIKKGMLYPAVLVTSSLNTRFGVWEAAKWVARVRELTVPDPGRPILLNLTTDIVEENRYLQCKETALETSFLIKMMEE